MPIHDWTLVRSNRFHDFHQSWTVLICSALNAGLNPSGHFAMVEQKASAIEPDIIAFDPDFDVKPASREMGVNFGPFQSRFVQRCDAASYARKANRITIRHPDGDVVAVVEIVSPGNKDSRHAVRSFARKAVEFLHAGIHLLIVDLFPPSKRDPQGIHKVIWDRLRDEPFVLPPDKPLTVAAYAAGTEIVGYIEPCAVGDPLPDMPVFLTAERYVPCPLETTYQVAWEQFPAPLRGPLELPPT